MKKKTVFFGIIILLILVGGWFWVRYKKVNNNELKIQSEQKQNEQDDSNSAKQSSENTINENNDTNLKKGTVTESEKLGWKKYRNEYFHFEFEYPKNWYVEEDDCKQNNSTEVSIHGILFFAKPYNTDNVLQIYPEGNWRQNIDELLDVNASEREFNGYSSYKYDREAKIFSAVKIKNELPKNWKKDNEIIFLSVPSNKWIFDHILDSWRFF